MNYFNIGRWLALGLLIVLPFQNCGQDLSSDKQNSFTGEDFESSDCLSDVVDCGARDEFLQISIDLETPISFAGTNSALIMGRCNSGNYPSHIIRWEMRNPLGTAVTSGNLSGNQACVDGYYSFMLDISTVPVGLLYSVYVKILGVDENGKQYQNVQANGSGEIEFSK